MKEIVYEADGTITENDIEIVETVNIEYKSYERMQYIINRLNELSQDFVQVQCGAVFEDLEERKQEFRDLHNELRLLEGKEVRVYQDEIKEIKAG